MQMKIQVQTHNHGAFWCKYVLSIWTSPGNLNNKSDYFTLEKRLFKEIKCRIYVCVCVCVCVCVYIVKAPFWE
jgi:hypothetical protein